MERLASELLEWAKTVDRKLPWKETNDPYYIWLSEIILQQTRVAQGTPYYLRFIERFPSVFDLAAASQDEVFEIWEGLGYYSRARNLHAAAKTIVEDYNGEFPATYDDIIALKGIGPYTAAAIASFAYKLPYAVVDGNVYRVLARVFGIDTAIDSSEGKSTFTSLAQSLLPVDMPDQYNQAIMDFGALQCIPKSPNCAACPMESFCLARCNNRVDQLPAKKKKIQKRKRYFHYLIIENSQGQRIIERREQKDIWNGLYQFPMIETEAINTLNDENIIDETSRRFGLDCRLDKVSKPYKQTLSHQYIIALFYVLKTDSEGNKLDDNQFWVHPENEASFSFPKIIRTYKADNTLSLF